MSYLLLSLFENSTQVCYDIQHIPRVGVTSTRPIIDTRARHGVTYTHPGNAGFSLAGADNAEPISSVAGNEREIMIITCSLTLGVYKNSDLRYLFGMLYV